MVRKRAHPLMSEGARLERKALRTYLRRLLQHYGGDDSGDVGYDAGVRVATENTVGRILEWVQGRQKRYDKRPGGLGRR